MATAKILQIPEIIEIIGSTIRVKHPDISGYTRTEIQSPLSAAGTALTVSDNNDFKDDDWFILGEKGDYKTEECDVNGTVTRGTALTITNTTKFAHEVNQPVIKIYERGIKIYGAATDGGAGTLITSIDAITTPIADAVMIQWNKQYTEYTLISTDTTYAYYYAVFTDGTTSSSASDYVLAAGLPYNSVSKLVNDGLKNCNAFIDNDRITQEWLLTVMNDWQDEYANYVDANGITKDWSFEVFEEKTSIASTENEDTYALSGLTADLKYTNSERGLIHVKFGIDTLTFEDIDYFEKEFLDGVVRTNLASAASIGDTSITIDDSNDFSESGTIYLGAMSVTYTANAQSTGVLSGIPASGSGSVTATAAIDSPVWQGKNPGLPEKYTVFGGNIILDVPVSSTYAGRKIKIKGVKKLSRLTSFSDTVQVSYTDTAKDYLAYRIELKKGNRDEANQLYNTFRNKLEINSQRDPLQPTDETTYYEFDNDNI